MADYLGCEAEDQKEIERDGDQDRLSPFWIWMGSLLLAGIVIAIGSVIIAAWLWPSLVSRSILVIWIAIAYYLFQEFIIKPLYFKISMFCSRVFGW